MYYKPKIIREPALFSQDHVSWTPCIVEIPSKVHRCASLTRQLEPHSLLH